jgi:hypothetical protein
MLNETVTRRFWAKVLVDAPDRCWNWIGKKCGAGYGGLWGGEKQLGAHRVSFLLHKGEIPNGMVVQHDCDNPSCVNPAHLTLGTHKTNSDDKIVKGRWKPSGTCGEQINNARLTEGDVRLIRTRGGTLAAVATEFGVSQGTIWNIRTGRTWRHVS